MEDDMRQSYQDGNRPPAPNGMASASLVLGILSLVMCFTCFPGAAIGVLAIIFAVLSRKGEQMNGQAKAGLTLGIISMVLVLVAVILMVVLLIINYGRGMETVPPPVIPEFPEVLPGFENLLFIFFH